VTDFINKKTLGEEILFSLTNHDGRVKSRDMARKKHTALQEIGVFAMPSIIIHP